MIARQHGLAAGLIGAEPWIGATSCVYPISTHTVVKVPHADADAERSLRIDVSVGPIMRAAGVRTPRVIAFEDSLRLLARPYAVLERVAGVPLASAGRAPDDTAGAWRELGRDLALVHQHATPHPALDQLRTFDQSPEVDPRPWVDELARADCLSPTQANRLTFVLDRLAPAALVPVRKRLCHGDVNAANVIVTDKTVRYRAVIDWAGAGWLDPAWDLASIPLPAVLHVLEGHRQVASFEMDETAEARALWCHVLFALHRLWQQLPQVDKPLRDEMSLLIANVEEFLGLVAAQTVSIV